MIEPAPDEAWIAKLRGLASVLICGMSDMPEIPDLVDFDDLLRTALAACGYAPDDVRIAIDAIPPDPDWAKAKEFAAERPAEFGIASTLASAAYFMSQPVLAGLGFPADRRQPAEMEDFLGEYETGILEPVIERNKPPRTAV